MPDQLMKFLTPVVDLVGYSSEQTVTVALHLFYPHALVREQSSELILLFLPAFNQS